MFFADDLILFAEASQQQFHVIKNCLDVFCDLSGEKVNYNKSMLHFSKGVPHEIKTNTSSISGMKVTDDLGTYLGMPTEQGSSRKRRYQYIVDKVNKRLSGWKSKLLSFAGRITLAKSALEVIPCYAMLCKPLDCLLLCVMN